MGLTRRRTLYFVTFLALVVLSLRPVAELERAIGMVLAPVRVASEFVAPLSWVTRGSVRAATAPETPVEAEREVCQALLEADQLSARPTRPELYEGRLLIHAEVVGRKTNRRDRVVVVLPPGAVAERGMPVVHGDHYVGRVTEVDPGANVAHGGGMRATVELVTAASFRIGARMQEAPFSRLVVGGLAPPVEGTNALMLAAHKPADRSVKRGEVEVFEPTDDASTREAAGAYAGLANGYRLGELVVLKSPRSKRKGQGVLAVQPGLDYKAGLYQLVLLGHGSGAAGSASTQTREILLEHDPFAPADWLGADVVLNGAPSFWREGRKLKRGASKGVEVGAAVKSGARFIGRISAVQGMTADVALLGDRGLELPGLAWIDGRAAPFSLGRLIVLGRTPAGDVRLRWDALVPFASDDGLALPAQLFTGSGERGVPRGLLVGEILVPPGPGPHELLLVASVGERVPAALEVRRAVPLEAFRP